jgi:class 3 adenylate cyclase
MSKARASRFVSLIPPHLRKHALAIFALWALVVAAAGETKLGRQIEYQVANRSEFHVRAALGRAPALDGRLRIFGYDDRAVAMFERPEMTLDDWAVLLEAIAARRPRAIIIDQMFGFLPPGEPGAMERLQRTLLDNQMIAAGAFAHPYRIPYREMLDLSRRDFRLDRMTDYKLDRAGWLPIQSLNVYGPHRNLRDTFAHIGHIVYPGEGRITPLVRVSQNVAVPHLTLYAADELEVDDDGLELGGVRVPLDDRGRIAVNFSAPETYFNATLSLKSTLNVARTRGDISSVHEGDIVLVIPLLYTGNHDVLDTPVGRIPGGYILAANINSILTGQWLDPVNAGPALSVLAAFAASVLGFAFGPVSFWPAFLIALTLLCGAPLLLFAYAGTIVPWFFPALGFVGAALTSYAVRVTSWVLENRQLRDALKGTIPEGKLQAILSGRGQLQLEASERIVTLLFLDIANFSVVAEQNPPKAVFMDLKTILRDITKIVHKYGGTIDKTLGDGLLAFFGYSYDGEISDNQADQAIQCAIEIQRENMRRCLEAASAGRPILPFRIGINTGAVYIGDIGSEDRIDFTVIGNGVNYAQRLESACEHHSIMLSATTMNFSSAYNPKMSGFKKRYIHIKHHDELLEAIEYNPFHDDPDTREAALLEFRKSFNLERKEQRWPVDDPTRVTVDTDFGAAALVDFSASGLCLRLDSYLSKGVVFDMVLLSADGTFKALLEQKGISRIKAEVRWGKSSEEGFTHGLKLVNLSEIQLDFLFALLREVFTKNRDYAIS